MNVMGKFSKMNVMGGTVAVASVIKINLFLYKFDQILSYLTPPKM